jgi:hypothetical protein
MGRKKDKPGKLEEQSPVGAASAEVPALNSPPQKPSTGSAMDMMLEFLQDELETRRTSYAPASSDEYADYIKPAEDALQAAIDREAEVERLRRENANYDRHAQDRANEHAQEVERLRAQNAMLRRSCAMHGACFDVDALEPKP